MKLFENWGKKTVPSSPQEEQVSSESLHVPAPQKEVTNVTVRKPKTMEDIDQARRDIDMLQEKRNETLAAMRKEKETVRNVGVNEFQKDSHKRTETFRDLIDPIEKELQAISTEITEIREEHDLEPDRVTVLNARFKRLEDLKEIEEKRFLTTETGGEIHRLKDQIRSFTEKNKQFLGDHPGPMDYDNIIVKENLKEIEDRNTKITRLYREDKEGFKYATTIDRIHVLMSDVENVRRHAKQSEYDDNGQMRIR